MLWFVHYNMNDGQFKYIKDQKNTLQREADLSLKDERRFG